MQGRQVQDVGNGIRDLCILLLFFSWFCGLVGLGKGQMEDVLLHTMELKSRFLRKVYETTTKKKRKKQTYKQKKRKEKMFSDDQASREALCWIKYFGNGSKGTFRHTEIMMIPAQRNKRDQSTDTFTLEEGITNLSPAFFRHFKLHPWQQRKAIIQSNKMNGFSS